MNVIKATILKGQYKGDAVLIPRIPMIPKNLPFDFKRFEFSEWLRFAMPINKSQGKMFVASIWKIHFFYKDS